MSEPVIIHGAITAEVIQTITTLMADVLGAKAVEMVMKQSHGNGAQQGAEVMYALTDTAQNLLGPKGAFATLRQVGRSLAKSLMEKYPREQWEHILASALNDFGFASRIELEKQADRAFICNCVFYEKLQQNSLQPTSHAVCWAGWGFIEGFMREAEGVTSIVWKQRDQANQRCEFDFLRK